jgi:hypothetical protein
MSDAKERKSRDRWIQLFFWCLVAAIALSAIARVARWM